MNAIVAGKLDIGVFGTTAPVAHIANGAKIKIIGGIIDGDAALIATPASAAKIASVGDLQGK
ncbi:MAG TPA: ABC transporter substrate-binding protein [Accumulibacter sp.]|nr:ABC transporter substrate-binding protein [Accumulibacter sp.]